MKYLTLIGLVMALLLTSSQSHALFKGCGFYAKNGQTYGYCKTALQYPYDFKRYNAVTAKYTQRAGDRYNYSGSHKRRHKKYVFIDYRLPKGRGYQKHWIKGKLCVKSKKTRRFECVNGSGTTTW